MPKKFLIFTLSSDNRPRVKTEELSTKISKGPIYVPSDMCNTLIYVSDRNFTLISISLNFCSTKHLFKANDAVS